MPAEPHHRWIGDTILTLTSTLPHFIHILNCLLSLFHTPWLSSYQSSPRRLEVYTPASISSPHSRCSEVWSIIFWSGHATSCKVLVDRISGTEFVLNNDALRLANGTVQTILDCMPTATKVLVDIDEIPTTGGIIVHDPITIQSTSDNVRLLCCKEGIKVRCVSSSLLSWRAAVYYLPSFLPLVLHISTVSPIVRSSSHCTVLSIHLIMSRSSTFTAFWCPNSVVTTVKQRPSVGIWWIYGGL